jgi:hypothetical protein
MGMGDLDRRKHDVDIIERVIGGIQEGADGPHERVIGVEVPSIGGSPIVELVVNLSDDSATTDRRRE